jgi:hypothetical protein
MTAAPVNEANSYSATVGRFELTTPRRRNADGGSLDSPPARVNVLTGRPPAVGSQSSDWFRPIVRPHARVNHWPMNSRRSRGDNALTLSALLLAGAATAWAAWVWYGRWRDAETTFEHRAVTR